MSHAITGAVHRAANLVTGMDRNNPLSRSNANRAAGLVNLASAGVIGDKINTVGKPLLPGNGIPTPVPEAPVVMPLPDSAAVEAAKKRQAQAISAGGGRASTVLSNNDSLG